MTSYLDKAKALGYTVGVAQEGYTDPKTGETYPDVHRIEGHGVSTMLRADDKDAWEQFLVPEAHEHRAKFTRHQNPDDDFTMTEEEIMTSSFNAAVATKGMTRKQADKSMAEWRKNVEAARAQT